MFRNEIPTEEKMEDYMETGAPYEFIGITHGERMENQIENVMQTQVMHGCILGRTKPQKLAPFSYHMTIVGRCFGSINIGIALKKQNLHDFVGM